MRDKVQTLLDLLDNAICEARKVAEDGTRSGKPWVTESATTAIENFTRLKDSAMKGTLLVGNGAGLGITRGLSEWDAPSALYRAGRDVEVYFMGNF